MVRYNVAPVGQLPLQEPVPLLQQAEEQDGDWDLLVDRALNVFIADLTVHISDLLQPCALENVRLIILFL